MLLALSDSFYHHHIIELLVGFVGAYSTISVISAFSHPKVIALVSNILEPSSYGLSLIVASIYYTDLFRFVDYKL